MGNLNGPKVQILSKQEKDVLAFGASNITLKRIPLRFKRGESK